MIQAKLCPPYLMQIVWSILGKYCSVVFVVKACYVYLTTQRNIRHFI